jgi:hypothetical protein
MAFSLNSLISKEKKVKSIVYDKDWGVSFDIAFLNKVEFQNLIGKHTKITFDPKTHQSNDKLDTESLNDEIIKTCIKGWKGVTFEWLSQQIVLDTDQIEDMKAELAYSEDNAIALLKNAYGIDNWLIDTIRNAANFNDKAKEAEVKN